MKYDIVIVGGGIVGATAALALAKNTSLRIALLESTSLHEKKSTRVSAI
jgi:2-polyprenyl-6-methoxyphenol hydroxylase-like FAD-dependent oxidoreductase